MYAYLIAKKKCVKEGITNAHEVHGDTSVCCGGFPHLEDTSSSLSTSYLIG